MQETISSGKRRMLAYALITVRLARSMVQFIFILPFHWLLRIYFYETHIDTHVHSGSIIQYYPSIYTRRYEFDWIWRINLIRLHKQINQNRNPKLSSMNLAQRIYIYLSERLSFEVYTVECEEQQKYLT